MNSQYEKEYMHMILVCLSWEYTVCLNSHKDQQLQAGLIAQLVRVLHCYHK